MDSEKEQDGVTCHQYNHYCTLLSTEGEPCRSGACLHVKAHSLLWVPGRTQAIMELTDLLEHD